MQNDLIEPQNSATVTPPHSTPPVIVLGGMKNIQPVNENIVLDPIEPKAIETAVGPDPAYSQPLTLNDVPNYLKPLDNDPVADVA